MKLLILFGPPSVGKATIGQLIESNTDFKLFHNHMVMDGIMHIFGVGTPSEDRLSKLIRTQIIQEAAESGINLIFTYVWNFGREKGRINIDTYKAIYEKNGGEVLFIELTAPLAVRIERANHPDRKRLKAHAPDSIRVEQLETTLDCNSPSPFFYPDAYVKIDTTNKTSEQTAQEIIGLLNFSKSSTLGHLSNDDSGKETSQQ
jgi:broad-specificity NMP kinase